MYTLWQMCACLSDGCGSGKDTGLCGMYPLWQMCECVSGRGIEIGNKTEEIRKIRSTDRLKLYKIDGKFEKNLKKLCIIL